MKNSFFPGEWVSSFRPLKIAFNENVWALIPDSCDDQDGSLFGLIDPKDGTSFGIDWVRISEDETYDYGWCEAEYFSRLFNADNSAREARRFVLAIDGAEFRCVAYSFANGKYGSQIVVRGMSITGTMAIGIGMAWPSRLTFQGEVPPKLRILLNHCEIGTEYPRVSDPVVYDKAKYHHETVARLGLPDEHAYNHTTFFMSWLVNNRLTSREFDNGVNNPAEDFRQGRVSINELYEWWDCCLSSEMLSDEGNAFAQAYFDFAKGEYLNDYEDHLQKDLPSEFHVPYTDANEAVIHKVIDERFKAWKRTCAQ